MALTVATNTGALMAQAAASSVNKEMEISMERLSTGKRINGAADDAAGVAIASRLTSEIRGTNQAIRNALDGQALIDTAEGAHVEVVNILQRMRELAVQAANGTNSSADRTSIQTEMDQLTTEIDRIAGTTSWAGQALLDGNTPYDGSSVTALATDHADAASFKFQVGSGTTSKDIVTANIGAISSTALSINGTTTQSVIDHKDLSSLTLATGGVGTDAVTAAVSMAFTNSSTTANSTITFAVTGAGADTAGAGTTTAADAVGGLSYASGTFSFELDEVDIDVVIGAGGTESDAAGIAQATAAAINAAGITGVTASASGASVSIDRTTASSVSSLANATTTIGLLDEAIKTINTQRATLGSISNRLDNTVSNLTNISNNLQAGRGRIEDADFAAETTNLAKTQILQQASTAMLAQANAAKQNVLSLLQG
ncbi:MAG: flagellin [Proteobacteria bacterium]|nr:flagellin [Pseudomonadota bacterium]